MPLTNFPNGLSSYGCSLPDGAYMRQNGKKHWYVQGNVGNNGNPGDSPDSPFLTMAKAFTMVGSGDTIHFTGNIKEQLSTPVGIFDVTIVGEGNRPRHADAHTGNNGYYSATWKSPSSPAAATPLLKIRQQGWRLVNILFSCPADAAGVQLFRDGGAGDLERDASHAHIIGCRFDGGQNHIEQSGGCAFVTIEGCLFRGSTAASLKDTAGAGIGTLLCWRIFGNHFHNNESHLVLALSGSEVAHNSFGLFTTMSVDLNNGPTANVLFGNAFSGTYSIVGGYRKAVAGDSWGGNYNVIAGGVTAAVPA